ncbi:MAG: N-acetylmuramoyl-L-alanine amidase family protein [Syntrophales bacterium]
MNHRPWKELTGKEKMVLMNCRMVRVGIVVLALLIACLLPVSGESAPQNRYTVLIDPAHGGDDPGVVSDQLREKDLTMNIALLIRQEAQKGENLLVQLTRSADRTMTVAERIKAAAAMKPDCLISLHINAGFGKTASGYEVYFPGFRQNTAPGGESAPILKDMVKNRSLNDSVRLAQQIQASIETVFPRKGRGLRDAPSPLLDGVTVPGLIVELGFATNPEERKRLTAEETQRAIARALVKGIRAYFAKTP